MSVIVLRHGLSEANNRKNIGTLAFAASDAPLMEQGRTGSRKLHITLKQEFGIDTRSTPAATSTYSRTMETAILAGHVITTPYGLLDEVSHGLELPHLRQLLDQKQLPVAALRTAEAILEKPPSEAIWYTHGLVIAGLCKILDTHQDRRFIPEFCEARALDF